MSSVNTSFLHLLSSLSLCWTLILGSDPMEDLMRLFDGKQVDYPSPPQASSSLIPGSGGKESLGDIISSPSPSGKPSRPIATLCIHKQTSIVETSPHYWLQQRALQWSHSLLAQTTACMATWCFKKGQWYPCNWLCLGVKPQHLSQSSKLVVFKEVINKVNTSHIGVLE